MSCIFCESFFHVSHNCDVYDSDKSRRQLLLTKNCCSRCCSGLQGNDDSGFCPNCIINEKCNICFLKGHHTVFCPDQFSVSFIPNIDKDLLPRFVDHLNLEEKYLLAFLSPICVSLIKPKKLTIVESNANFKEPFTTSLVITRDFCFSPENIFDKNHKRLLPSWHSIIFKCEKIIARRVIFYSSKQVLRMLTNRLLQLSLSNVKLTFNINFIEILKAAPNLEVIDFSHAKVRIDNSWPEDLIKWNKGNGLRKLRIPFADFDMNSLMILIETLTKSKPDVKIVLDIFEELSTEALNQLFEKLGQHFVRFNPIYEMSTIQIYYRHITTPFSFGRSFYIFLKLLLKLIRYK